MANALEAKNISVAFGGLLAVNDVSFNIPNKSIVSLLVQMVLVRPPSSTF